MPLPSLGQMTMGEETMESWEAMILNDNSSKICALKTVNNRILTSYRLHLKYIKKIDCTKFKIVIITSEIPHLFDQ